MRLGKKLGLVLAAGGALSASLYGQTLGQVRIVDFSARQTVIVSSVASGFQITTATPHGLATGAAVYIYQPLSVAQDSNQNPVFRNYGNRGRGYFTVTVTDGTHFALTAEMYTGLTLDPKIYTVLAGDHIVPLTTYYVRQGPRLWLDGPINRGPWSAQTSYRPADMVTDGGQSYMAIADNTNQEPPNASWTSIDPTMIGPGTFSASLRNTNGKASNGNLAYSLLKSSLTKYWPQPAKTYDYGYQAYPDGFGGSLSAERWFADGDSASYAAAVRLATQTEDLADGTPACDPVTDYCGRDRGNLDFARLDAWKYIPALGMIYDTLTSDQKRGLLDRLFNDNDVTHNGVENNGGTNCDIAQYNPGPGPLSVSNYVVKGSGFSTLDGMQPGAVIVYMNIGTLKTSLGRVKSVDSDTQITLEQAAYAAASGNLGTVSTWWYVKPFGYGGAHTCGVLWFLKHHPSSPRAIPGQEGTYGLHDYTTITTPDDSPRQNKSISALVPFISAGLLGAFDDLRAVRQAEQSINYYMTQTMAQEEKSRGTGLDGHGTQYGTGRTGSGEMILAWILKNSLTVTPPGVVSGSYLKSIMQAYQYVFWLGNPLVVQPWATGYGININGSPALSLSYMGMPMMVAATMYPNDPFAGHTWDYLRNRRGDYGNLQETAGWGALAFQVWAFPFYDPLANAVSITNEPMQRALWNTDVQECIDAGLYCRPDTGESLVMSQTGWGKSDTQVMVQAQAALPTQDDDNYGTAGNVTILQNNGANGTFLLGGNGLGLSGYGSGQSPSSGMEQGNTVSLFNPATGLDMWAKAISGTQYARLGRWAGDPVTGVADNSYSYAMVDLAPTVRDSTHNYDPANAAQECFYLSTVCATAHGVSPRINRHVIHFKKPADPNYVVIYDDIQTSANNLQPRAYFHYIVSSLVGTDRTRHPDWLSNFDVFGKNVLLTIPGSARLSSRFLAVPGAASAAQRHSSKGDHNTQIAVLTDQPDGSFKSTTGLPAALYPGTYRVTLCASHDGSTCATVGAAEWIAVHKPSTNLNDAMPPTDQPGCQAVGGGCAALEIQDAGSPKVAVFARQGALVTSLSFTTTHAAQAQYVLAGLAPGVYTVTVGTTTVVPGGVVGPNDNTLSFSSAAGVVSVVRTGVGVSSIAITPSTTIAAGSQQQMSAMCTYTDNSTSDCTASVTWASSSPDVTTISTTGLVTGVSSGSSTISGSYLGAIGTTIITVN